MNIVCLCTALPAESRPLIEQFQLRLRQTRGLRCYYGESVYLVETGIGKLKSASAVAAVLQSNDLIDALINVGIAGGAAELGNRFIAGTVVDNASGEAWHPHLPSTRVLKDTPTSIVHTLDKPSADYQADVVFDMEASGVFTAASNYLDNSRIQCLKTISDNHTSDFSKLKKEDVSDLVGNCLQQVTALVNHFHAQPTRVSASAIRTASIGFCKGSAPWIAQGYPVAMNSPSRGMHAISNRFSSHVSAIAE